MKRIISFILAFVLVLGMLPMAAVSASAAVTKTSDKAIEFIKAKEGFNAKAFRDGKNADGTQRYSIGYGTTCKVDEYPDGINKVVASDLLKKYLEEVTEPAVAAFATKYSLNLTQAQFDALVSISFNCGHAWLQETGTLRTAVISGMKGNSFLYAMGLWSTANGGIVDGLIERRLAEANMYLNGKYDTTAPSNYTYAKFDIDGDHDVDKVQAYDALVPTSINVTAASKTGETFAGWYNGTQEVKQLDMNTKGVTLTATYSSGNKPVNYTIKVSELADKTPYVDHKAGTAEIDGITLKDTDSLKIVAEYVDAAGIKWVQAEISRFVKPWFELGSIYADAVNNQVTVTITANTMNVRADASVNSADKGDVKKNDKVLIIATKTTIDETPAKGSLWGKIASDNSLNGYWICLDAGYTNYAEAKGTAGATSGNTTIATGKIIADALNIRAAATTDSAALATQLKKDDTVKILAIQNDGNKTWGKIAVDGGYGWINLAYVDMTVVPEVEEDDNNTTTPDNTPVETKNGTVANTDNVNIRAAAGARNKLVKTLPRGTRVTVYETTTKDNALWGRIGDGQWVAMMYITLDTVNSGSTGSTGSNGSTAVMATGVVNSTMNLKVRTGPGMTYNQVSSLPTGTQVSIYEETTTAGASWGRIGNDQWVCLNYVTIQSVAAGSTSAQGVMATVVNCANAVNIRAAAGVGNALVGVAAVNSRLKIYETTNVNGISWGRSDKGWVCMDYIRLDGVLSDSNTGSTGSAGSTTTTTTTITATVTANSLNIRKDHSNTSDDIGDLVKGDKVTITEKYTETTETETKTWGKFTKDGVTGWINLAYTTLEETTTTVETPSQDTTTDLGYKTGKIINVPAGMNVNVRTAAGVHNTQVTSLPNGTAVKVYEQVDVNNATWARIDQGWVYMYYIQLDTTPAGTTGTTGNAGAATGNTGAITNNGRSLGIVNSNIDLNVRIAPSVDAAKVGALKKGTQILIYEQTMTNGMLWGRIDNNQWVSLSYVTLTASAGTGTGVMGTITNCGAAVNVRTAPGVNNALVGTIQVNSRVEIYEQTLRGTQYWGRVNQGWICMQYVTLDSAQPPITDGNGTVPTEAPTTAPTTSTEATTAPTTSTEATTATEATEGATNNNPAIAFTATATITSDTLNVRKEATADSEKVYEAKSGDSMPIYALKAEGDKTWAQVGYVGGKGWINIGYANVTGGGAVTEELNVRKEATSDSEKVGTLPAGAEITFNQIKLVGEKVWGKATYHTGSGWHATTVEGWINLGYVKMGAKGWEVTNPPAATLFTATVKERTFLYSECDATKITRVVFERNDSVNITEVKQAGGRFWGKVYKEENTGWVMLDLTSFSVNGTVVAADPNVVPLYRDNLEHTTGLELANGTTVQITAVKNQNNENWAKVTVESNTGWVKLANLTSVFG